MVNRTFSILAVLLALAITSVLAQDPGAPDTLRIDSIQVNAGTQAVLPITFFNDETLGGIQMPFGWTSDDITVDSVSFVGARVNYVATKIVNIDNPNQKVLTVIIVIVEPDIPAGDGLYGKIYFNVPPGTPDQRIYIDTMSYSESDFPVFAHSAEINFVPVIKPGKIIIGNPPDPPTIGVNPTSFSFDALAGASLPAPKVLTISNQGGGILNWQATWSSSWLQVLPNFGAVNISIPQNVQISVNTTALPPDTYYDTIIVSDPTATNDPVEIPVQYTIIEPPPTIQLNPTQFIINAVVGGGNPPSQILNINNIGQGLLEWMATNSQPWLTLNPSSGSGNTAVSLDIDITGMTYGIYYDTIVVSDPDATNSPQKAYVRLELASDLPLLEIDSTFFFIIANTEFPPSRKFNITNGGGGSMTYYTQENSQWITSLNPASGSVPHQVTVNFKTIGAPGNDFFDTVWVFSNEAINSPQPIAFQIHFTTDPDDIIVNLAQVNVQYYECGQGLGYEPVPINMTINNGNLIPMQFQLWNNSSWLTKDFDEGYTFASTELYLQYRGLAPGVYYDTLIVNAITAVNSPIKVPVMMTILETAQDPELYVDKDSVYFAVREGTDGRRNQITVHNQWPGCIDWQLVENIPWLLSGVDSSDYRTYPWYLDLEATAIGSAFGLHVSSFLLTSSTATNAPVEIQAVMDVWRFHGDCDYNGTLNILDIVWMIAYKFKGGPPPQPIMIVGDVNCDYKVDIVDIAKMIDYEFHGGGPYCGNPYK